MSLLLKNDAPFAKRNDTMYLGTIESKADPTPQPAHDRDSLVVSDIRGAQTHTTDWARASSYLHKDPPRPVTASNSRQLIPGEVHRPLLDRHLRNDDIEFSMPRSTNFKTNRVVDPLEPLYSLPSYEAPPAPIPPLRYDPLKIDDIEGTSPKRRHRPGREARDPLRVDDIAGTRAGWSPSPKRTTNLDTLSVKDINMGMSSFKSTRVTDPLSPRYVYDVPASRKYLASDGRVETDWAIGELRGSHSRPRTEPQNPTPFYPLITSDIRGASPERFHMLPGTFREKDRKEFRNVNYVQDIVGATPKKHLNSFATQSERHVDPLSPQYTLLEGYREAPRFSSSISGSMPPAGKKTTLPMPASTSSVPRRVAEKQAQRQADIDAVRSLQ